MLEEVKKVGGNITTITTKATEASELARKAMEENNQSKTAIDLVKKAMDENASVIKQLSEDLQKTIAVCDRLQIEGKEAKTEDWQPMSYYIHEAVTKAKDKIVKSQPGEKFPIDLESKAADDMRNVWRYREQKAVGDMTTVASLTGAIPITYRREIITLPFELIHIRNLVSVVPSDTDTYNFYQAKIGEGAVDWQANEDAVKPQLDDDLVEVSVTLNYLAGWERISRKMLRNFSGLRDWLSRWLPERYYKAEDSKAINALGAAIPAGNKSVVAAGDSFIDGLIAAIAFQKNAGYQVNGIVTTGTIWGALLTYKDAGGLYNLPGTMQVSPTGQIMLLGIPVYTASWIPANVAILGDWNYFNIVQSEGLNLSWASEDRDNFVVNKITVKVEACVGFAVLQPNAFYQVGYTPGP